MAPATPLAPSDPPEDQMTSTPIDDDEVRARADALLARMTVEEKAGQLTQYFTFERAPAEVERIEAEVRAGRAGSLLFVCKADEIDRLQRIAVEENRLGIPLLFGFDVIHGLRTIMPVPLAGSDTATWPGATPTCNSPARHPKSDARNPTAAPERAAVPIDSWIVP